MCQCPFCETTVPEELVINGGHCPHCLNNIPGEETPTDPGEQLQAEQAAAETAAHNAKRGRWIGVAVVLLAGVIGGAGWKLSQPEPVVEPLLSEDDFIIIPLSQHKDIRVPGTTEPLPNGGTDAGKTGSGSDSPGGQTSPTGGRVAQNGQPEPQQGSVLPSGGSQQSAPADPFEIRTGGPVGRGPEAIVLTDRKQIGEMIKKVLGRQQKQLQTCYANRLAKKSGLQGSWKVAFSLNTDGRTSDVGIRAMDGSDGEFEACLQQRVSEWKFQAIKDPMYIERTFTFPS